MPQRSLVSQLPSEIRQELDKRLIQSGFGDYQGLSDWLAEQGFTIKKSALNNYGKDFEARCEALRLATLQAREMRSSLGDEQEELSEMALQLVKSRIFNLLIEEGDTDLRTLSAVSKALSDVARASLGVRKYQQEVRQRAEQAAQETGEILKQQGISDETAQQICAKFLGIAA